MQGRDFSVGEAVIEVLLQLVAADRQCSAPLAYRNAVAVQCGADSARRHSEAHGDLTGRQAFVDVEPAQLVHVDNGEARSAITDGDAVGFEDATHHGGADVELGGDRVHRTAVVDEPIDDPGFVDVEAPCTTGLELNAGYFKPCRHPYPSGCKYPFIQLILDDSKAVIEADYAGNEPAVCAADENQYLVMVGIDRNALTLPRYELTMSLDAQVEFLDL